MNLVQISANFKFLAEHDPIFLQLASSAERTFASDPNTTLIKLRQLGEAIAQDVAVRCGVAFDEQTTQADLLYKLSRELRLDPVVRDFFYFLRIEGNKANHQFKTKHADALDGLKIARGLAVWFHQSFGKQSSNFKPSTFVAPIDPSKQLGELQTQIQQLRQQLTTVNEQAKNSQKISELIAKEKTELAVLMDAEATQLKQDAKQYEDALAQQKTSFESKLKALQAELAAKDQKDQQKLVSQQKSKLQRLDPTEKETRILIDQHLIEAGWEENSQSLTYQLGAMPEKGKNKAIAEWHTRGGQRADYVLFAGLVPIAVVEAKRKNTNVAGKITQAERYAKSFELSAEMQGAWLLDGQSDPWSDGSNDAYRIPFAYSCNGRPFIRQLAEQSGTWFRDVRHPSHLAKPLQQFHSPDGLIDLLKRNKRQAEQKLSQESFAYLKVRDYSSA
jgi:type I restriction enzyme R subunit